MDPTHDSSGARRFIHTCRGCQNTYRVVIHVDQHRIHQVQCPRCGRISYFDNRSGGLDHRVKTGQESPAHLSAGSISGTGGTKTGGEPGGAMGEGPGPREPRVDYRRLKGGIFSGKGDAKPALSNGMASRVVQWMNSFRPKKNPVSGLSSGIKVQNSSGASPLRSLSGSSSKGKGGGGTPGGNRGRGGGSGSGGGGWRRRRGGSGGLFPSFEPPSFRTMLLFGGVFIFLSPVFLYLFLRLFALMQYPFMSDYADRMELVRPNRIVDRNGELIGELFASRTGNLTSDQIPDSLKKKLVFTEDEGFYNHGAISWSSVARAFVHNLAAMGYSEGGSTLTQQLARILLDRREKTIFRKLKEASLAYYLEDHFTKDQILTAYMNHVYLGHGAVGMDTAARFYFDKKLGDLDFVEQLVLVCLPSAPVRYSPLRNPALLSRKMDSVFHRMHEEGFTKIEPALFEKRKTALLRSMNKSPMATVFSDRVNDAPFLTEYIRQKVRDILGSDFQYGAGLTIETTVDRRLQLAATRQTKKYIRSIAAQFRAVRMQGDRVVREDDPADLIEKSYRSTGIGPLLFGFPGPLSAPAKLQAAAVGIRPDTGEILFVQGGAEFSSVNQLNRAFDMRRQTGSAIKPIIYAAGIESGVITPVSKLDDTPFFVAEDKKSAKDPGYWLPANYTGTFEGPITAREALVKSKNIPAIRLASRLGMQRLEEQFRRFFFWDDRDFKQRFREDYTIAIGSLEMSPLEMAVAFSAFGDDGVIHRPYLIRRILNRSGRELYNGTGTDEFHLRVPPERRVLPGDVAEVMGSMMEDAATHGGLYRGGFNGGPVMGKTGTTNDSRDAWFVGIVPGLAAAVWVGYDNPAYSMPGGTGAGVAGPLWARIVSHGMTVAGSFEFSPRAVQMDVCEDTGSPACGSCRKIVREYFARDHVPAKDCSSSRDGEKGNGPGTPPSGGWSLNNKTDFQ